MVNGKSTRVNSSLNKLVAASKNMNGRNDALRQSVQTSIVKNHLELESGGLTIEENAYKNKSS